MDTKEESEPEFCEETEEMFLEKEQHKQHAQQCVPEKRLKTHGKRGEDTVLKAIGQLLNRACFEPM